MEGSEKGREGEREKRGTKREGERRKEGERKLKRILSLN